MYCYVLITSICIYSVFCIRQGKANKINNKINKLWRAHAQNLTLRDPLFYAFYFGIFRPFSVLDQHSSTACHSSPFSVSSHLPSPSDCSWLITYLLLNFLAPPTGPELTNYRPRFGLLALVWLHYLATSFRIGGLYWYFAASRPFFSSRFISKLSDMYKYKYTYL